MNKKKWLSLIAVVFMIVALIMFTIIKKENTLHDYFWIPLVLGAVFLFMTTRVK